MIQIPCISHLYMTFPFILLYCCFKDLFLNYFSVTIYTHFIFFLQHPNTFLSTLYLFRGLDLDLTFCTSTVFCDDISQTLNC